MMPTQTSTVTTPSHLQAAVLIRWTTHPQAGTDWIGALSQQASALVNSHAGSVASVDLVRALDGSRLYLYLWLHPGAEAPPALIEGVRDLVQQTGSPAITSAGVALLSPRQDETGASSTESAPFHYAVELDIEPEHAQSMTDWYNTEHLPGLAAVPGTVRARRLADPAGHPASYACYDLTTPDTLQSDPWLAVRATDWSSRIRPLFQNVRRTVFERLLTFEPSQHRRP